MERCTVISDRAELETFARQILTNSTHRSIQTHGPHGTDTGYGGRTVEPVGAAGNDPLIGE
jgi:hypothetical protein